MCVFRAVAHQIVVSLADSVGGHVGRGECTDSYPLTLLYRVEGMHHQLVVLSPLWEWVLRLAHAPLSAELQAAENMCAWIALWFYWPGIQDQVLPYCAL